MNTDLIQMLVNVSHNLTHSGINLVMTLAGVMGIVSALVYLLRFARPKSHRGVGSGSSLSKMLLFLMLCGGLIALKQMMNASAHQLGFGDVSFEAIAYVSKAKYGPAAEAINAVLTLLRLLGVIFFYQGLRRMKRSLIDGHTGLTAGEDVSNGVIKLLIGTLLICNPYFLTALQNTLNIVW
ncbi:conjugal transfer protein TraQ [Candidatus Regiella endosymbiont of Tuberolachnus salignus]|uniref:conjugal transfer protein TraQ n=1 Tax=Candidatus Regiella endosymbiont of Tuberolachnus salignus TaxID=3077956 RepID=UPI0030CBAD21